MPLLSFVEFPCGDANQKFPFLLFRLSAEGSGEEPSKKCKEIFGFAAPVLARAEALPA